jgi:hypothetical protein
MFYTDKKGMNKSKNHLRLLDYKQVSAPIASIGKKIHARSLVKTCYSILIKFERSIEILTI